MNLRVVQVVSSSRDDHEAFGVVDPDPNMLHVGSRGVGTRVILKDVTSTPLVELIVGKKVAGTPALRYIRKIGSDEVYTSNVQPGFLTTTFVEWIEKNLLKMKAVDIKQIEILDYSVDVVQRRLKQQGLMTLACDDSGDARWKILEDKATKGNQPTDLKLAADEEINNTKLEEMSRSLGDLKIVDVRRKPKGLSDDLKGSGQLRRNKETVQSLAQHGFYLTPVDGGYGLFSDKGELRVTSSSGVEYVVRFGSLAMANPAVKVNGRQNGPAGLSFGRYIFIVAQFNAGVLERTQLESMPLAPAKSESDIEKLMKSSLTEELNKRRQEVYDAQVRRSKEKVKELNDHLADWYFIIPDDVYQSIHLSRSDIVKKRKENP